MATAEHRLVALVPVDDALWQVTCTCGWYSRSDAQDCLDYLAAHIASQEASAKDVRARPGHFNVGFANQRLRFRILGA